MRPYPPPLGTAYNWLLQTWCVIYIGTGRIDYPLDGSTWTKRQVTDAMREKQGREVPTVSPQLRRVKTADVA